MAEIANDAVFTNVEITDNIIHNGQVVFDFQNSTLYVDNIITSNIAGQDLGGIRQIGASINSINPVSHVSAVLPIEDQDELLKLRGEHNLQNANALAIGGELNESTGKYSSTLGGMYNECSGDLSVSLGGSENKAYGKNSVTMGVNTFCNHNNTFLFNTSEDTELESTMDKQFLIGSDNGMMFKLPKSAQIQTHNIPEGFACWCWDTKLETVIMKTKQNGEMFKTIIPTNTDNIRVQLNTVKKGREVRLNVLNPDLE